MQIEQEQNQNNNTDTINLLKLIVNMPLYFEHEKVKEKFKKL